MVEVAPPQETCLDDAERGCCRKAEHSSSGARNLSGAEGVGEAGLTTIFCSGSGNLFSLRHLVKWKVDTDFFSNTFSVASLVVVPVVTLGTIQIFKTLIFKDFFHQSPNFWLNLDSKKFRNHLIQNPNEAIVFSKESAALFVYQYLRSKILEILDQKRSFRQKMNSSSQKQPISQILWLSGHSWSSLIFGLIF